jgi:DNA-binding NarL/FixJ family response regulator
LTLLVDTNLSGNMQVLIVDNNSAYRLHLAQTLNTYPEVSFVDTAETFEEAVVKTRQLRPDLLVCESSLRDGSCLDMMEQILPEFPETKVIILTNDESEELLLRVIQSGARGYLIKDGKFESMLAELHHLNQDEFIVSPKMAQAVFQDYSRIKGVVDRQQGFEPLTSRERDVLRLACLGASNREIAGSLVISENTVRVHLQSIFRKLNLKNRREARNKYLAYFSQEIPLENTLSLTPYKNANSELTADEGPKSA